VVPPGPIGLANALNAEDGPVKNTTSKTDVTTRTTALLANEYHLQGVTIFFSIRLIGNKTWKITLSCCLTSPL
jgi:hypothetical protein